MYVTSSRVATYSIRSECPELVPRLSTFMSDHVADQAGFLAALSKADPEWKQAEAHARSCAPCREALEEGVRLAALLRWVVPATKREPITRTLPAAVREAVSAAAIARRLAWATTGAVVLAWLFQLTVGGGFRFDLDCALASLAVLGVAVGCVTLLRGNERLAVATVVVTSGLFAYLSGSAPAWRRGSGSAAPSRAVGRGPDLGRRLGGRTPRRRHLRPIEDDGHRRGGRAGGARRPAPRLRRSPLGRAPADLPLRRRPFGHVARRAGRAPLPGALASA